MTDLGRTPDVSQPWGGLEAQIETVKGAFCLQKEGGGTEFEVTLV